MANNRMLIDASHPEETRVVVLRGSKVEEFDFESASKKPLRGNIYLAKVTRVEPSLQAAFIEYGGNRHGFLAFSEIHPDYYQIPVADRQALIEAEAQAERDHEREEERRRNRRRRPAPKQAGTGATVTGEVEAPAETEAFQAADDAGGTAASLSTEDGNQAYEGAPAEAQADDNASAEAQASGGETSEASSEGDTLQATDGASAESAEGAADASQADAAVEATGGEDEDESDEGDAEDADEEDHVEQLGGGDAMEDLPERPRQARRQYKIQEVIKRRQILLVQVVKEERGNKGAALTTYLSLAGRYSVLMPNTGRGGGISRKITNAADRKRLKEIAQELEVPEGMGIILRTAGASRTKPEIKRDYEYLMRMWESVRELTLKSAAPALVYEEGSLIKRAIRDLYNKDTDEIVVAGDEGYREARDFMRMLMPSHVKIVRPYKDPVPLFAKTGIEAQLDAMFSTHVTLKSGGYLVINPTEALVSIDVNSGRSTREHNIEDTALRTNLEASEEIARQLRLRDLAGLIVIDFIDMEEKRNNRAVEKKLNDCLKNDRARIQVGRISPFGLLEMSRQRIRTGVLESSSVICPHCAGAGSVRSTPSVALQILRAIEEALIKSAGYNLHVRTRTEVAFYILNQKRIHLRELETRFGVMVTLTADDSLMGAATYSIERGEPAVRVEHKAPATGIQIDTIAPVDTADEDEEPETETNDAAEAAVPARSAEADGEARPGEEQGERSGSRRRRRRRRRGRGGEREHREGGLDASASEAGAASAEDDGEDDEGEAEAGTEAVTEVTLDAAAEAEGEGEAPRDERGEQDKQGDRRRRGRRGGRGRERDSRPEQEVGSIEGSERSDEAVAVEAVEAPSAPTEEPSAPAVETPALAEADGSAGDNIVALPPSRPDEPEAAEAPQAAPAPEPEPVAVVLTPPDPDRPKRAGWWSRAKSALSGS
jgi:ribonuclease E